MKTRFAFLIILLVALAPVYSQRKSQFKHILITNDDGVEDINRLMALANKVSQIAEKVSIVIATSDRSGTSNHTEFGKHQSTLEVKCRYFDDDKNISLYTMSANPADCILISLSGLFDKNNRPDLVISGINGGSNIGPDWFGSGTIGAARTAAFLGVKSVAISGFNDDIESSFELIPNWIVKFLSTRIMNLLEIHDYLTISFPKDDVKTFKGIKISPRTISFELPENLEFEQIHGEDAHLPNNSSVWTLGKELKLYNHSSENDLYYLEEGYVVINAMTVDENNISLFNKMSSLRTIIPEFN